VGCRLKMVRAANVWRSHNVESDLVFRRTWRPLLNYSEERRCCLARALGRLLRNRLSLRDQSFVGLYDASPSAKLFTSFRELVWWSLFIQTIAVGALSRQREIIR